MICTGYVCDKCSHEHEELFNGWDVSCDAFPNGNIPESIYFYAEEGDDVIKNCANGIGFEPKEEQDG